MICNLFNTQYVYSIYMYAYVYYIIYHMYMYTHTYIYTHSYFYCFISCNRKKMKKKILNAHQQEMVNYCPSILWNIMQLFDRGRSIWRELRKCNNKSQVCVPFYFCKNNNSGNGNYVYSVSVDLANKQVRKAIPNF